MIKEVLLLIEEVKIPCTYPTRYTHEYHEIDYMDDYNEDDIQVEISKVLDNANVDILVGEGVCVDINGENVFLKIKPALKVGKKYFELKEIG